MLHIGPALQAGVLVVNQHCLTRRDTQWHGMTRHWHAMTCGMTWHGMTRSDTARHDTQWHGTQWRGMTRHGMTCSDTAWHGMAWHAVTRHDTEWHGVTRSDTAWHGVCESSSPSIKYTSHSHFSIHAGQVRINLRYRIWILPHLIMNYLPRSEGEVIPWDGFWCFLDSFPKNHYSNIFSRTLGTRVTACHDVSMEA